MHPESQRDVSRGVKFSDDGSAPTAGWEILVGIRHSFFRSYTSTIGLMTHCRIFLHFLVTQECHRVKALQKRALVRDKRQCKGFRHPARTSRQLDQRYERHIDPTQHTIGTAQTQKIASKHSNLRTRIKRLMRRTLCLSKTTTIHDVVIGLFINRYECGVAI